MGKVQYRYHVELIVPIRSIGRHETIYGDTEADHRTYEAQDAIIRCKTEEEARERLRSDGALAIHIEEVAA